MKKTNFLFAAAAALYSPRFYREVASSWRARSFGYLAALLAVMWLFLAFSQASNFWVSVNKLVAMNAKQMPVLTFKAGVASTKQPGLYRLQGFFGHDDFMVVDVLGKTKDFQSSNARILITKDAVLVKKAKNEITTHYFPKWLSGTFGPNQIMNILDANEGKIVAVVFLLAYIVGLASSYIFYLLFGFLYALIGMIFVAAVKSKLKFGATFSLALVAFTPCILLNTILSLGNVQFPGMIYILLAIALGYLFFAIIAAKKDTISYEQS